MTTPANESERRVLHPRESSSEVGTRERAKAIEAYCSFCGHPFSQREGWPRWCEGCEQWSYRNPVPVAVVLQPVREDTGRMALLVIRRAIEPCLGQLALPGGFVDYDEDWREAARRELWEETGIALEGGAAALQLFEVLSKRPGNRLVLFAVAPALELSALPPFVVNDEVSERRLIQGPTPLAFPLHTEVADRFFATLR